MVERHLGKITSAEFGQVNGHEFLIGLQLEFHFDGGGVGDGGKYTVNLNEKAWEKTDEALGDYLVQQMKFLDRILKDAKCRTVSQLKGKPVEVTVENRMFKDFRILTEVL
ncbi:hypothetical protein CIC07_08815 [Paenibacillus sp. RUD330]|nr:hypothetical protein CIC07_08815 [Paenibacillus sp. RUD330]